jgi:fructose-1,6-bisphosphatase I
MTTTEQYQVKSSIPTWTLERFLRAEEDKKGASGELTELIASISVAVKIISNIVSTAGFKGLYGYTSSDNASGDTTAILDRESDEVLIQYLKSSRHFGLMVSEEQEQVISAGENSKGAKYVVAFDPLDGSSNIGSNIPVGTIFSIWRKKDRNSEANEDDFLQTGRNLVAAGYSVYGSKTSFVYSVGSGVHDFTLDPTIGEFLLTDANVKIPEKAKIYSINESTYHSWNPSVQRFINELKDLDDKGNPKSAARYVGSLVADFDRNLKKGGIFLYPGTAKHPRGKLRLLYEVIPLSFICEQAGGRAVDGEQECLDIMPKGIHDRAPLIVGSKLAVDRFMELQKEHG